MRAAEPEGRIGDESPSRADEPAFYFQFPQFDQPVHFTNDSTKAAEYLAIFHG